MGNTALMRASNNGYIDVVKLLVEAGAQIYTGGANGTTIVQRVKTHIKCPKLKRLFLELLTIVEPNETMDLDLNLDDIRKRFKI